MTKKPQSIPRPLVRLNQWTIVLSVILTWITQQEYILLIPLLAGLSGLIFKFNPIMKVGTLFLRKDPSEYIPEDFDQQQFNQVISVVCLALGFLGYLLGWTVLAVIFTVMVALAAFIAILGFCIGCYIRFQWQQYNYRKSLN
ncbi:DUF4395 domain-containing protein [Robertmurraya yapensis]|uniref:DUF4395 domain-containing protein n=2 Tax=Bacillaceae TaxID=186817 RepID=A0A431VY67_9BACI|nr:DUF4395 domain-containing protein [Bacillus yapensis]RTR27899.1 DUF4395 domain-containing protein [Bacillus yapensis]TKS94302.1 DUF4395 family protein [Bacillus yapensis]